MVINTNFLNCVDENDGDLFLIYVDFPRSSDQNHKILKEVADDRSGYWPLQCDQTLQESCFW
jgi:hypothetical protein